MPSFSFEALDAKGQPTQGRLDAATENEAVLRLSGQGLRVTKLAKGALPVSPQTIARPQAVQPTRVARPQPAAVVRTKRASYRDLSFFFNRLGLLWRSGVPLSTALSQLASSDGLKLQIREAAADLSQAASQGGSIADAMERYPDVFPEGACGAVRAGEAGGYVPEACRIVADQTMAAHKTGWTVRIGRWVFVVAVLAVPWGVALTSMMRRFVDWILNEAGGSTTLGDRFAFMSQEFWRAMAGLPGIGLVVFVVGYIALARWAKGTSRRPMRHELGLRIPVFQQYARGENLWHFTWHLSKLSGAGLAPQRAWALAAAATPNLAFGKRLRQAALTAKENTPYSEILARGDVVPPEYAGLISTGEMAGDVSGAFDQTSKLAQSDVAHWSKFRGWLVAGVATAVMIVLTIIVVVTFYGGYYSAVLESALKE